MFDIVVLLATSWNTGLQPSGGSFKLLFILNALLDVLNPTLPSAVPPQIWPFLYFSWFYLILSCFSKPSSYFFTSIEAEALWMLKASLTFYSTSERLFELFESCQYLDKLPFIRSVLMKSACGLDFLFVGIIPLKNHTPLNWNPQQLTVPLRLMSSSFWSKFKLSFSIYDSRSIQIESYYITVTGSLPFLLNVEVLCICSFRLII